ncbi:MAG: cupredoxin domain-containing protein [Thermomicrobium sp.]|nr:cupredoxin domain-containing protein [Thermomicrobium sp.]MDW8059704.1 cupredoxin domain-containing protein [Thermomicrobium sp.]
MRSLPLEDPAAAPDVTVSITLTEFSITPATITVPLGEPVTFVVTNTGGAQHNLEVELESQGIERRLFDTNLMPGETRRATFTFEAPGEWEIYCPVGNHRALGTQRTIVVAQVQPTPTPSPSPTEPPTPTAVSPTAQPGATPSPTPGVAATPTPRPQLVPATGSPRRPTGLPLGFAAMLAVIAGVLLAARSVRRRLSRR